MAEDNNEIIIYQSEDGETHIDVKFTGETVWLSQQQMADLYQSSRSNVVEHIKTFMRMESLMRSQPVGISDRFVRRVPERWYVRYRCITLT